MVRAPCCDKMGLKKGPWTPEEDQILVSFIQGCGHGNWRALPKQAGLMRCGKSCRLRWMNYLRPDIKRGNFSKEEEATIINLHELLGNRWSAIAARLPGRTDNEIKNVWHTHLKQRARPRTATQEPSKKARSCGATAETEPKPTTLLQLDPAAVGAADAATSTGFGGPSTVPSSPPQSCSEFSSAATESSTVTRDTNQMSVTDECTESSDMFVEMDERFWSDALSLETSVTPMGLSEQPAGPCLLVDHVGEDFHMNTSSSDEDDVEFWLRVLMGVGGLPEQPSRS